MWWNASRHYPLPRPNVHSFPSSSARTVTQFPPGRLTVSSRVAMLGISRLSGPFLFPSLGRLYCHAAIHYYIYPKLLFYRPPDSSVLLIVPNWSTQPWYPGLRKLLTMEPITLPIAMSTLIHPREPPERHPLQDRLKLMACILSGIGWPERESAAAP